MTLNTNDLNFVTINRDISVLLTPDDEALLYDPDSGEEKCLNRTGLFIWKRLDGSRTMEEIAEEVSGQFSPRPSDRILDDTKAFLTEMVQARFATAKKSRGPRRSKNEKSYPGIMDAPNSLDISLTGKCNLDCRYCFYDREMQSREDLKTEEWTVFFKEIGAMGTRDLCLSGGEVFIRSDLWDLIDSLIGHGMRYSLLTNGTLVTEKTCELLLQGKRALRLDSVQVSIDGASPEIHDRSRGDGSFEKAVRGLRLLKEAGLPVTSRVTVNRYNVDSLDHIARFLLEDIGLGGFSTNDAMPIGAGCFNQHSIALEPLQRIQAMQSLSRLAEKFDGRITATAGPLANRRIYRDMEKARSTGEKTAQWEMGYLTACGCVFGKLAIHHDGTISPCNMLSGLELGRINRDSIKEIWADHPTLKALKERRDIPLSRVPGCEDCEWTPYCNGSCPGIAYEMTGDFNRGNPHDCYRRFLEATKDGSMEIL